MNTKQFIFRLAYLLKKNFIILFKESDILNASMNMSNFFILLGIILYLTKTLQPKEMQTLEKNLIYFLPIPAVLILVMGVLLFQSQNLPGKWYSAGLIVLGLCIIGFSVTNIMHLGHKKSLTPTSDSSLALEISSEDNSMI
jgi:hypothetical protein